MSGGGYYNDLKYILDKSEHDINLINALNKTNNYGKTPSHISVETQNNDITTLLLDRGANRIIGGGELEIVTDNSDNSDNSHDSNNIKKMLSNVAKKFETSDIESTINFSFPNKNSDN